jgi:NTE family protein
MPKTGGPRIGIALSGGSALGIAHIGALKSLSEHQIPIDCIAGTSAGAIVAACYAFNVPLSKVLEKARKLSWYSLSNFSLSTMGFISNASLGNMVHEFLGDVNIEDATIPLAIVATDIETGERVVFTKGSLIDALKASACIPGIFIPVKVGGRLLVDGSLVDNLPLDVLDALGATVKIGVNVNRWISRGRPKNPLDVVVKSLEIATAYRRSSQGNEIIIEPHLEPFSASDFRKADQLAAEGHRAATQRIKEIQSLAENSAPAAHRKPVSSIWRILADAVTTVHIIWTILIVGGTVLVVFCPPYAPVQISILTFTVILNLISLDHKIFHAHLTRKQADIYIAIFFIISYSISFYALWHP